MAASYLIEDLQDWNQRIVELVQHFHCGLLTGEN